MAHRALHTNLEPDTYKLNRQGSMARKLMDRLFDNVGKLLESELYINL